MNVIFFGLKRAYYASLLGSRVLAKRYGLTPARFDVMYLLETSGPFVEQRAIWRKLGVSRATTSRMLNSLEALGLIRREAGFSDARQRIVFLTQKGKQLIKVARTRIIDSGLSDLMMESASTCYRYSRASVEAAVGTFESHLVAVQQTFCKPERTLYSWAPYDPFERAHV